MPGETAQERQLPYPAVFHNAEEYVDKLLEFATSSDLLQTLCGGVHVLDFLTRSPDLYETVLPAEWRQWLHLYEIQDILDLLMREDIDSLLRSTVVDDEHTAIREEEWRGRPPPPQSLLKYIQSVRNHTLSRLFSPKKGVADTLSKHSLTRNVRVGMKPKKAHEVENFAAFVADLSLDIARTIDYSVSHFVDFGSGQNYLGRALASPPYCKRVIAIESKQLNINGAMGMDILAKLAEKKKVMRNKKAYRLGSVTTEENDFELSKKSDDIQRDEAARPEKEPPPSNRESEMMEGSCIVDPTTGTIQYIEHIINDGCLTDVAARIQPSKTSQGSTEQRLETSDPGQQPSERYEVPSDEQSLRSDPQLMVISLHSCGNLLHHGLRSLILNSSVKAVAMVGCCYNLVTERLGPPTYKYPTLRPPHPRLDQTGQACDPHGFPMSQRLLSYKHKYGPGIRLNITARMMAVQAPQNWTLSDSEAFFTRHFYRAVLQRIFLDYGIVERPMAADDVVGGRSPRGWSGAGQPIVIGSLRKSCYCSFTAYVRGAVAKLAQDPERGPLVAECMKNVTDEYIRQYEQRYRPKKKELSILWSLMAFSAGVVESVIVVDRWLYLKEHEEVKHCWVETVFDYKQSPRNLAVIGVKR
ncbi:hypothetical protein MMC20_001190 [Loxospora ochrophaea]|nr:hypothetical protein [Loxospora ochrophaea]